MKRIKSNLPYYLKMQEKLASEISSLQSQVEQKQKELLLLNSTVESLKELEGVSKKEEIKFPLENVSSEENGNQRLSEKIMEQVEELETGKPKSKKK